MIAWAIASVSLVLPLVGVPLCILGGVQVAHGSASGWLWLASGAALIVLDAVIDFVWARSSLFQSDVPDLNRRADQLADRHGVVIEAIEGGRGKIRLGDTLWVAEGPDLPVGTTVRIMSAKESVLVVEPARRLS
jgi:membrane protein implicated in regulation of membrane protease activity